MTRTVLATTATGLLLAAAAAAPADARTARYGTTTIRADGPAARSLAAQRVLLRPTGAARLTRGRLTVPITAGRVTQTAALSHAKAGIRLSVRRGSRTRTLTLSAPRVGLGARSTVTAVVAGLRRTVFTITGPRPRLDADRRTARLSSGRLVLTRDLASRLQRTLRVRVPARRTFGSIAVQAAVRRAPAPSGTGTPGSLAGPAAPTRPSGPSDPAPSLPDGLGRLPRPATATPIRTATFTWRVRESFVNYMRGGNGGGSAITPATKLSDFDFAFAPRTDGWYDPASGKAAVYFDGTVRFRYPGRFDFTAADPEVEINGPSSRAIFRFDGQGATTFANRRGVLVDLQPLPAPADASETRTYTAIPGVIPAGTSQSVFGDFYVPGDAFGTYTVSFTTSP